MSAAFRDLFLPKDQVPLTGQFTRRLDLAAVLDAVAVKGISEFYSGNVAQKMASAVRINIFFTKLQMWLYKWSWILHSLSGESFSLSYAKSLLYLPSCSLYDSGK